MTKTQQASFYRVTELDPRGYTSNMKALGLLVSDKKIFDSEYLKGKDERSSVECQRH